MASPTWSPSVIVGIDFGMTCTGVAFSSEISQWARPEVIQRWPDRDSRLFNKFPSRLGYNSGDQVVDWGRCNTSQERFRRVSEFKLFLNQAHCGQIRGGIPHYEAVQYYVDYMTKVNIHINKTLSARFSRWNDYKVEYRFSIPTTWKSPLLNNQLKGWLSQAGFVNSFTRRVIVSRTEAEAAAIYVAKNYEDLNIFKVIESTPSVTRMEALDKAEGVNIGSTMIDTGVRNRIVQKLDALGVSYEGNTKWLAEDMMEHSNFETFKRNLKIDNSYFDLHLQSSKRPDLEIVLRALELEEIFEQITKALIYHMREKIVALSRSHVHDYLQYIVLSGGLGSSPYIISRLMTEFHTLDTRPTNIASNMEILVAPDPQLAVVKGLVMDRSQSIELGIPVYTGQHSRVSYGLLSEVPYRKDEHFGERIIRNEQTGTYSAVDQIQWLIKEGDIVSQHGIDTIHRLEIKADQGSEPFKASIVMCELPASTLPSSMHRGPVVNICTVEGRFSPDQFVNKDVEHIKKSFFGKQKEHFLVKFKLRVIVGSTDLRFEIVSLEGRRYHDITKKLKITWDEFQPTTSQADDSRRASSPQPLQRILTI